MRALIQLRTIGRYSVRDAQIECAELADCCRCLGQPIEDAPDQHFGREIDLKKFERTTGEAGH